MYNINDPNQNIMAETNDIIASDLEHIPRGDAAQNKLRQYFQYARMRSLGKDCMGTREYALMKAIARVQAEVPDFKPQYDMSYFEQEDNILPDEDSVVQEVGALDPHRESVLVSLCLCGIPCRYHGLTHKMGHRLYKEKLITKLKEKYDIIPVCPEVMGGLPTPRCPCEVTWNGDIPQVINRNTKEATFGDRNLTEAYQKGAEWTLWMAEVFNCRKAYMLKMSPACDPKDGVASRLLSKNGIIVRGV
jgi:uncharacterized protein YbbK (DUF523 family)